MIHRIQVTEYPCGILYFCAVQWVRKIINFYIDASIHVALAVYAMFRITLLNLNIPHDKALAYVVCCATIVVYNFMKFGTTAKKYIIVSSQYLKIIQIFSFLCFGILIFYMFQLSMPVLLVLIFTAVLSGCYVLPFLPGKRNFRGLHGVKIYIVALCWCIVTVLLPVIHSKMPFSNTVIIECVQRFLLVLVLVLPFDIRDLKHDALGLGTIPQQIGIFRAKKLGLGILLIFYMLSILKTGFSFKIMIADATLVLISGFFLIFSKEDQSKYYSGLYVESIPLIWLLTLEGSGFLF